MSTGFSVWQFFKREMDQGEVVVIAAIVGERIVVFMLPESIR